MIARVPFDPEVLCFRNAFHEVFEQPDLWGSQGEVIVRVNTLQTDPRYEDDSPSIWLRAHPEGLALLSGYLFALKQGHAWVCREGHRTGSTLQAEGPGGRFERVQVFSRFRTPGEWHQLHACSGEEGVGAWRLSLVDEDLAERLLRGFAEGAIRASS